MPAAHPHGALRFAAASPPPAHRHVPLAARRRVAGRCKRGIVVAFYGVPPERESSHSLTSVRRAMLSSGS
eukprot:scaffold25452_cov51-Phaeocystis_antarctica.AAC.1